MGYETKFKLRCAWPGGSALGLLACAAGLAALDDCWTDLGTLPSAAGHDLALAEIKKDIAAIKERSSL